MKESKQQQTKKSAGKPPRKSLAELCQEKISTIHDAKREREDAAKRAQHREQEDEMMAMIYGPNWRTKQLPFDPPGFHQRQPDSQVKIKDDDFDDEFYDDPRVNRKAS